MAEQLSKELAVAIGVYIEPSNSGRYSIRAAHFYEPTLLFDPLYSKSVVKFGTQAHGQVRSKLVQVVGVKHLEDIADSLGQQSQLFSTIEENFVKYIAEKNLPLKIVEIFFRRTGDSYRKLAFAEQSSRLQKLQEASGSQLDLLEAIKNPDDTRFGEIFQAYQRMHKVVRDFAAVTSQASALYDAAANKIFGYSLPTDLVKFGEEPQVMLPEREGEDIVSRFSRFESAAHRIATDPLFIAGISRRRQEALDDLGTLADLASALANH